MLLIYLADVEALAQSLYMEESFVISYSSNLTFYIH